MVGSLKHRPQVRFQRFLPESLDRVEVPCPVVEFQHHTLYFLRDYRCLRIGTRECNDRLLGLPYRQDQELHTKVARSVQDRLAA